MSSAAAAIGRGRGQLQLYFDDQVDIWKTRGTSYLQNIHWCVISEAVQFHIRSFSRVYIERQYDEYAMKVIFFHPVQGSTDDVWVCTVRAMWAAGT